MLQLPILQPPLGYMTWLQSAVSGNAKFTVKQFGSTHHHHEETAPDTARLAWFSAQLTSPFGEAWCEQQAGPGSALVHQFSVIWRRIFVFFQGSTQMKCQGHLNCCPLTKCRVPKKTITPA